MCVEFTFLIYKINDISELFDMNSLSSFITNARLSRLHLLCVRGAGLPTRIGWLKEATSPSKYTMRNLTGGLPTKNSLHFMEVGGSVDKFWEFKPT